MFLHFKRPYFFIASCLKIFRIGTAPDSSRMILISTSWEGLMLPSPTTPLWTKLGVKQMISQGTYYSRTVKEMTRQSIIWKITHTTPKQRESGSIRSLHKCVFIVPTSTQGRPLFNSFQWLLIGWPSVEQIW